MVVKQVQQNKKSGITLVFYNEERMEVYSEVSSIKETKGTYLRGVRPDDKNRDNLLALARKTLNRLR